jgi:acyl-[acyl-carrier-protein]-phospholipid O-acyltransferase/long-chain-fatty-acid--[acyl-carrier-protein] ligase
MSELTNTFEGERSWRRGFWSLFATQFQGAFSDNVFRFLVVFIGSAMLGKDEDKWLVPTATALFTLPFVLFSMTGGWLADRFSKRTITVATKVLEIAVMGAATIGLALHSLHMLLATLFLMGMQSALFSPSKYGLLPELLPEKRLSWGNGIIELGTMVAIITGAVAGGQLYSAFGDNHIVCGIILVGLAMAGLATAMGISRVPAADPTRKFRANMFGDLLAQLRLVKADRVLLYAVIGNTYFWFLGVLLQQNIFTYGKSLELSETDISLLQAAVAIGIGLGSVAAGYLSGRKIEYGLVPLGTFGITVFSALLFQPEISFRASLAFLGCLGFFGGFFIVPVAALLQHRPDPARKGAVLAAAGFLSAVGMFVAAGFYYALTVKLHLSPQSVFLVGSALTLAGTMYVTWLIPDSLLRLLLWIFTHTVYRIRVEGRDNIPERGGALFVSNHVSFVDALLVIAATDRPLRAIMFKDIYDHPIVKPFAKIMRAIPISSQLRPREMIKSLQAASDAIKNGEVVVIFAEGQITRIGQLLPFRRGFERIMKGVDAPIVPICLDNVWGSIFSYEKGRFLWKVPRYIPYPVTVSFGKPLPATATPFEVRQAVQELNSEAWANRKSKMLLLHRAFVRKARHHPRRFFMADARVPKLKFGSALTRTIFLARRLRPHWREQQMVGIFMPPSVAGALVNYAALLMGKVPVNLNYTVSQEIMESCIKQCGIKTVVTSKLFLEKIKLTIPCETILLEELAEKPRLTEKLAALAMTWTLPAALLERAVGYSPLAVVRGSPDPAHSLTAGLLTPQTDGEVGRPSPNTSTLHAPRSSRLDDLATIIFSSGSTGEPKGVMLTHYNIASNIEQIGQTFALNHKDKILGILPFFHSFGFTGTLMLPAVLGVGVVYHPSPLDARAIGELVQKYRVTFLLATPTFLQMYMRGCTPEQFGSLQYVVVGAEKLPERVAQAFEDQFGIRPLEAYGCTECSPAVTVNTRDFRAAGFRQVGAKRGKIGHPLPGVSVRIVNPETGEPMPLGESGLMLVRGPNVMKGYLGKPEKTAEVLKDGWYNTGDIAALDEDGFLLITDRLSRFSKIGGEMVPHIKVEEKLHELAGVTEQTFAVTGVPDEKKGERLVVLHKLPDDKLQSVLDQLARSDLPNLWKPRPDQFFRVESFPLLGTGKTDLRKVREAAAEFSKAGAE